MDEQELAWVIVARVDHSEFRIIREDQMGDADYDNDEWYTYMCEAFDNPVLASFVAALLAANKPPYVTPGHGLAHLNKVCALAREYITYLRQS